MAYRKNIQRFKGNGGQCSHMNFKWLYNAGMKAISHNQN